MPRKKTPADSAARQSGKQDRVEKAHGSATRVGETPVKPGVNPAIEPEPPSHGAPFPIVAVGASAGGIQAFQQFLKALPSDTGMAFVMILHLPAGHESLLGEILGRASGMPVHEASDGMRVEVNHVYVTAPGCELGIIEGVLQVATRGARRGQSRPIDLFMRALAESHAHNAIGIVLSGTGNDGTLGLEEIKSAGGITFAQDESAQQTGMPSSAMASCIVDYVLPPEDIARELVRIAAHPRVRSEDADPSSAEQQGFAHVITLLKHAAEVDFSLYKRNTLHRRITRRMLLNNLRDLGEYLRMLQTDRHELAALYQDLLINVTSFFRNPEAYDALKAQVFPQITEARNRHEPVRVWALGCSTGEEAYSIAIAYTEYAESAGRRVPLQVFATDLNGNGIEKARAGVYGKGIEQDVTPDRLQRFFVESDGAYRVTKSIRDMCVFARQNAMVDPPFSRIDLLACRNMLIYFEPALQQRIVPLLHYALRADGYLWLGGSETLGTYRELFELIDRKHKIYRRKGPQRVAAPAVNAGYVPGAAAQVAALPRAHSAGLHTEPQREADRILLSRYAPPGVLVNADMDILQFRGDTSPYLAPAPGRATLNLLKMLREGLLVAVRGAVHQARREKVPQRAEALRVRVEGDWRDVDISVIPLGSASEGAYLVLFEEPALRQEQRAKIMAAHAQAATDRIPASRDEDSQVEIARLTAELSATRQYLQSLVEQQEAANEELQSANEEIQSANEELQSINEELETSKEEIQSSNEELATVNDELHARNIELVNANNDLVNLLASVNMAIVILGPDMRIRRFTQPAEKILNLIQGDVGRPLLDVKLGVDIDDLESMVSDVMESVATREREVQDRAGRWYSLRVRPYRTLQNKIDGVVLVLVDVDNLKRAEQSIRESEKRFEALAGTAPVLIWVNDLEGCRFVNRAYEEFVGESEADIRKHGHAAFVHPDERQAFTDAYDEALRQRMRFEQRIRFRRADGVYRWMKVVGVPRVLAQGDMVGFVGCTFDITDMAEAETALRELDRGKNEFLAVLAHELRNPLSGVSNAARLLASDNPAEISRSRSIIERQTTHMVRMIDDLLDVSRITYGKIQLRTEPVDLTAILRRVIESDSAHRDEMQQKLEASLPKEPLMVQGDSVRLEQVFANLLGNASKFTRPGGNVWLTAEPEGGRVAVVRVRDNGVGIEPDMLPRIFELFVQADSLTERSRSGMGLGLTLAKRLVELHGGTIEAHSAGASLGSEFAVRLPLLATHAPAGAKRAKPGPKVSGVRILVVDDNLDSGDSLRLLLARAGHEVRTVDRGAIALPMAAELVPDLVVLDIGLPDIDGYTVAARLRADERTRRAVIIAVTGYGRDEDRARSARAGIDMHMTKPVDPDLLIGHFATLRQRADR